MNSLSVSIVIIFLLFLGDCLHFDYYSCLVTGRADDCNLQNLRQAELKRHNDFRALHGFPELQYDKNLQSSAQQHSDKMKNLQKIFYVSDQKIANNVYVKESVLNFKYSVQASNSWYSQINNYSYDQLSQEQKKKTYNFRNMIWKKISKVGFGFSIVKSGKWIQIYVAAHYTPRPKQYGLQGELERKENILPPLPLS